MKISISMIIRSHIMINMINTLPHDEDGPLRARVWSCIQPEGVQNSPLLSEVASVIIIVIISVILGIIAFTLNNIISFELLAHLLKSRNYHLCPPSA